AIAGICREAGVPEEAIGVVTTRRPRPVVAAMLAHPAVRALSFTGSTAVGRILLRQAADRVLKCSMELGGNAPFIVFDAADLDAGLDGLRVPKMRNGGQACPAANRILVHRAVHDEFGARLAGRMAGLRIGPGTEDGTECGPLISGAAVAKVSALVAGAVAA